MRVNNNNNKFVLKKQELVEGSKKYVLNLWIVMGLVVIVDILILKLFIMYLSLNDLDNLISGKYAEHLAELTSYIKERFSVLEYETKELIEEKCQQKEEEAKALAEGEPMPGLNFVIFTSIVVVSTIVVYKLIS